MRRNDRTGLPALLAMAALMSTAYAQGPGIYFNRVTTPRREIAAGPAQGTGRAASSQEPADDTAGPFTSRTPGASSSSPAYSSRAQEPKAPPAPPTRTTQHSYYPGMRDGQNPNRNV